MHTNEWHFRLDGEDFDIDGVAQIFGDEVKIIRQENGRMHLIMNLPFDASESRAALDAAEELLAKLNAIAQIVHGNHENLLIGGMGCKAEPGVPMRLFINVASSARGRSRVWCAASVVRSGEPSLISAPQKPIGEQMLEAADGDKYLDRALYLFGSLRLDWRGLYLVLETAEDAHGGEKGLIGKNWVQDGQIKAFKNTANSFKALRLEARHGTIRTGVDEAKLTLDAARDMIRTILERWCKEALTDHANPAEERF
ncbi:MAG TPA: hypothetical protein VKU01_23895 [Bryobacteraceae bacterium]|nr:hypothetical protein [Bryobacteraceae bacterium]